MKRSIPAVLCLAFLASLIPGSAAPLRPAPAAGDKLPKRIESDETFLDVRTDRFVQPSATAAVAAAALERAVPDLQVSWNARTGTVKQVSSEAGFLSGPSSRNAQQIARNWIGAHRALFGLEENTSLVLARDASLPGTGLHPIIFRIVYDRIPTYAGGVVGINVLGTGRIVSAWGDTGPAGHLNATPRTSAAAALRRAAAYEHRSLEITSRGQRADGDRLAIFAPGGGMSPHNVRLVAFPTATGPRLAWRVFYGKAAEEMLVFVIDATTGRVLWRRNTVLHEGEQGLIYKNYPGAKHGGKQEEYSFGPTKESPSGWVGFPTSAGQSIPSVTTAGNNVIAYTDWAYPKLAGAGQAPVPALLGPQAAPYPDTAPVAPQGKFDYSFANNWGKDCTPTDAPSHIADAPDPVGSVDTPVGLTIENPNYIMDRDPSVTNVFYLFNRIHDLSYALGFDEKIGNFQNFNFGKGGKETDAVRVMAQASIVSNQLNNAFFSTAPDGGEPATLASNPTGTVPSFSAMYLSRPETGWESICADLTQDASTVWHEYTHGITNRTVGDPNTADGLNAQQSGSMGEAWSDWFASHFLNVLGLEDNGVVGGYSEANLKTGYRNYAMDANPLTYGDFGYSTRGPEVHADGELWSATLWDLRTALIKKYGKKAGADRAGHLVYDALALSAPLPTYLSMRDDIFGADKARYKLADRALIWSVFAKRGMGVSAKTKDASDVHPIPAFDTPSGNATVSGVIKDADGGTVVAKVLIGLAEGAVNPVTVSKANGTFSMKMAPGRYRLSIAAPGYGVQRQPDLIVGSSAISQTITLDKNLASYAYGASVASGLGEGDSGAVMIDENEGTRQTFNVDKPVVIALAGKGPATVRGVSVLPRGRSVGSQMRKWRVETSLDGKKWTPVLSGGVPKGLPFTTIAQQPRAARKLAKPVKARFVRVTALKTDSDSSAQVYEVSVFGSVGGLVPRKVSSKPFTDHGTIAAANPSGDSSSVTYTVWQNTCAIPPAPLQGFDSWITQVPDDVGDGLHEMKMHNDGGTQTDIDVFFYAADCTSFTGAITTGAAEEQGPIPPATKWIQFVLYAGTTTGFDVTTTSTLQPVRGPTK